MPEIGRGEDFSRRVIGKLFRQNTAQAVAKLFAGKFLGGANKIQADHFETLWLAASETFDGQCEANIRLIRNRQHTTRHIAVVRPEMRQRLSFFTADLPGVRRRNGNAAAIFANFDGGAGDKILQAGAQLPSKLYCSALN